MKLYHDLLLEHYKNPRNKGRISHPHFSQVSHNPACGDLVLIEGTLHDTTMFSLVFEGSGCVISQATASLLTEAVSGMPCHDIAHLSVPFIEKLVGIPLGPIRLRCALLSLEALQQGLKKHYQEDI